jgi:peptide/nickel transport system permease protein
MTAIINPADPVAETVTAAGLSPGRRTWHAFYRNPVAIVAMVVMAAFIAIGIFAPMICSYPTGSGTSILAAPSAAHLFGTDNLGLDIFDEVIWGTRDSLIVGAAASALAVVIGVAIAVIGAYFPRVDTFTGMLVDICLSLPVLPLMILVAALVGPSLQTTVLVIAFFSWPEVSRVVRSQALAVVRLPYIDAARVTGNSNLRVIRKHVIPAVAPVIVVSVVLTASRAVLTAASLAFLGLGDPSSWSWGLILYNAEQAGALQSAWWTALFPSLAILLLVMSATLISIAYNDARDPHSRKE